MSELLELKEQLEELEQELEPLEERYETLENGDNEEEYNDFIDGSGDVTILGMSYCASTVLKECDPIAYNCGLSDYNDEEMSTLYDEVSDLENQISDLKEEIKALEEVGQDLPEVE